MVEHRLQRGQHGEIGQGSQLVGGAEHRLLRLGEEGRLGERSAAQGMGLGRRDLVVAEAHPGQQVQAGIGQLVVGDPQYVVQEARVDGLGRDGVAEASGEGQGGLGLGDFVLGEALGLQGLVIDPRRLGQVQPAQHVAPGGGHVHPKPGHAL